MTTEADFREATKLAVLDIEGEQPKKEVQHTSESGSNEQNEENADSIEAPTSTELCGSMPVGADSEKWASGYFARTAPLNISR